MSPKPVSPKPVPANPVSVSSETGTPALWCEHLVKLYDSPDGPVQAVRGVDFELEPGVVAAIAGPSGCGKSSLLRIIAGLDRPTAGFVRVDGVDLYRLSPKERFRVRAEVLAHIYQRPRDNLLAHLTVEQQLTRLVRNKRDAADSVDAALQSLGMQHRRAQLPGNLSGGEQQRVAVARALVSGHPVVVADEPTSQLDRENAQSVLDAFSVLAERGAAVVIATHDERLLDQVDRVVTMRDGAITSIRDAGTSYAVIDRSGRLQLPPDARRAFPDRRAVVRFDEESGTVEIDQP